MTKGKEAASDDERVCSRLLTAPAEFSSCRSQHMTRAPGPLGGYQLYPTDPAKTQAVVVRIGENNLSGVAVGAAVASASVLLASVQLRVDSCRGMDFIGGAG